MLSHQVKLQLTMSDLTRKAVISENDVHPYPPPTPSLQRRRCLFMALMSIIWNINSCGTNHVLRLEQKKNEAMCYFGIQLIFFFLSFDFIFFK
jgi:hypothetical protein